MNFPNILTVTNAYLGLKSPNFRILIYHLRVNLPTNFYHFLSPPVLRATSEVRQKYLTRSTDYCQTLPLGEPWKSVAPSLCFMQCMILFPDTCQSIIYNAQTQTCTPGSVAQAPLQTIPTLIPQNDSEHDELYYAKQLVPPCTNPYFRIHEVCGSSVCVPSIFPYGNYSEAIEECSQINSSLIVADTMVKFAHFMHINQIDLQSKAWLGLTDLDGDGTFVWADGTPLTAEQHQYIWCVTDYEPNRELGVENCVHSKFSHVGVHDVKCGKDSYAICESLN